MDAQKGNNTVIQTDKGVLQMFSDYDEILTVTEVMELLYIGKNSVYALLNSGELQGFRIGKGWRIPKSALADFIVRKCNA